MIDTTHFDSNRDLTHGECLHPAMKIDNAEDAALYLAAYEQWIVRHWGETHAAAHNMALQNIGYFAGYFSSETQLRMQRLFHAEHPVFGALPDNQDVQS